MFADKLVFFLNKRGMTQAELARRVNVDRRQVNRWVKNGMMPYSNNLIKVAEALQVSVSDLVDAKEENTGGKKMDDNLTFIPDDYEEQESFKITNDELADWAVERIAAHEAERDRLIELAKAKIETLKESIKDEEARCNNETAYLKFLLAEYFNSVPHKETQTQETYKLLSGKLVKKKAKQELEYDYETLLSYFESNNMSDFINVTAKPRWGEFKKALTIIDGKAVIADSGEVVDVVKVVDVPASFDVKVG